MDASATTTRHQVGTALVDNPCFPLPWTQPLNNPGERPGARSSRLTSWSGKWRESATDQFGPVTIDVVGVFDRTHVTVLEHVDARGSRSLTGAPGPCQRRRPA
jgi:hypothetical protein